MLKRGDLRIAIIGLVTDGLLGVSSAQVATQIRIRNSVSICDSLVKVLDPKSDVIIILSHCGHGPDRRLAEHIGSTIDVIVGGHSHDRIDPPEIVNGVIIVQAGAKLRYLGRLDLTIHDDRVTRHSGGLLLLDGKYQPGQKDENAVCHLVDSLDVVVEKTYGDTIGYVARDLAREYYGESSVGNWVADVMRGYTGADVAFVNSGGLRSDLKKGPVTRRDIMELLPMANSVAVFSCSGRELLGILRHNLQAAVKESHGILQQSGVHCSYRVIGPDRLEIVSARVGDEEIHESREYECASVDFVASSNPDKYLGFNPGHVYDYQIALSELAVRSVLKSGKIVSAVEGRMVKLHEDRK